MDTDMRIEKLNRAKMYLDRLANGIDPLTGSELPDDTVLNNVRLCRCFFFTAQILQEVIENGGTVKRASSSKLPPFALPEWERGKIELSPEPVQISRFCEKINDAVNLEEMRKLKVTAFGIWLVEKGLLEVVVLNGKNQKRVTPTGEAVGITGEKRTLGDREYYAISYNKAAQQFLLDHLDEIIALSNGE